MAQSLVLTIAVDGELRTSLDFTSGEIFRFGNMEFTADHLGRLSISNDGDDSGARFVGVTLSGLASLHTILETDADDDMSTSEEEGSSHFPLSRECNVITPPHR